MSITLASLKKGATRLGLEIEGLSKKKELEEAIQNKLNEHELGYECPICGKDIPDVDVCPFCDENFAEEAVEETSQLDEVIEEVVKEAKAIKQDDLVMDDSPIPAETVNVTVNAKPGRGKTKSTKATIKNENIEKDYNQLIIEIDNIVGETCTKKNNTSGITYFIGKKRIFKITSSKRSINIEFNVELETEDDNIKRYTEQEAKEKHLGTVRAIYSFGDLETAVVLVKEAYDLFDKGE